MSEEKKEYRYSVSAKSRRSATESHEDANKNYGRGTSDFRSQNCGGEIFLTVRFDSLKEIDVIQGDVLPELHDLGAMILSSADNVIVQHLRKRGVEIEMTVKPDPEPEPNRKGSRIHAWEKNPYPTVKALLKDHHLEKDEFADLKRIEEKHGGTVNSRRIDPCQIPAEILVDWLRGYYARREEKDVADETKEARQ